MGTPAYNRDQALLHLSFANSVSFPPLNTLDFSRRPPSPPTVEAVSLLWTAHISLAALLLKGWIVSISDYGSRGLWATWADPSHSTRCVAATQQMLTEGTNGLGWGSWPRCWAEEEPQTLWNHMQIYVDSLCICAVWEKVSRVLISFLGESSFQTGKNHSSSIVVRTNQWYAVCGRAWKFT